MACPGMQKFVEKSLAGGSNYESHESSLPKKVFRYTCMYTWTCRVYIIVLLYGIMFSIYQYYMQKRNISF